ncbi:hypothetical protein CFC21_063237 [Triticum aestivum]|uniref:Uncharacterized protein n=2 Tax=Triticum aestivum TaxID=4565 RepID=A0A3B6JMV2_WHEAT|nr:hypothetical protein CFC21_063237 [Triticum aestivum]
MAMDDVLLENDAGLSFVVVTPMYFFDEEHDFLLLLILLTTGCVCSLAKGRDFELPAMVELGMLADLTGLVSTLPTPAEVALLYAMLGNSPSLMGMLCTKC